MQTSFVPRARGASPLGLAIASFLTCGFLAPAGTLAQTVPPQTMPAAIAPGAPHASAPVQGPGERSAAGSRRPIQPAVAHAAPPRHECALARVAGPVSKDAACAAGGPEGKSRTAPAAPKPEREPPDDAAYGEARGG